ncbi:hypothetical protein BH24ACI1_BH24ACI1_20910 [soil metagenome]
MRHKFFKIKNFKGIEQVKIDFDSKPQSDVYTLVGLNESGKTTILEALNFFSYKAETLNPLNLPGYTVKDVHELIPISKRSNFNDDISIKVGFELDDEDNKKLKEFLLGSLKFFTFLLLTQYRGFRKDDTRNTLFLFDEPASNLHPSAQSQLLESFGKFPTNTSIMYTTHSHHMINPDWLEGTFVVKNEGLDYEDEDNYNAKNTNVTLQKYRSFVANHPNQTIYFQPILDVLDYSPGKLENVPNVVMVEGKNDFYTLKYFQEIVLKRFLSVKLMPGAGSGNLDCVIRLYLAWGRSFIILLDSDSAGVKEKKRYEDLFGILVQNRIFLLKDVDSSWNKEMESLIEKTDIVAIQSVAYPSTSKFNKTHFNRAIQELYLTNKKPKMSKVTVNNFQKLLKFCEQKLK